ncbi:spore coat U domain-containing protein [Methylomarinum sp. Ch1-1]|uniref:Spore coat U domain-containing protein n=1 Tax=Methylomarinum roseum TaxID=3067653 RepID=A0AAU7NUF6_9GAMM|nr:spore coat U domain-containing protein [Methylomarinum sp. Ch1-1]MDP4519678.1 spore coat U domain-containing protein [Methylomarinum sp. Ch1-1]
MNKLIFLAASLLMNMLWLPKASAVCSVNNPSLAFGSFSPLTGNTVDSTGTITVTCILQLSSYTIALSPGGSGTYNPRSMTSGGNTLEYNLYTDAGYSQIWGDGTGGSVSVDGGSALLGSRNHTVYGRIPLSTQRGASVGSYSDSITVTITYGLL